MIETLPCGCDFPEPKGARIRACPLHFLKELEAELAKRTWADGPDAPIRRLHRAVKVALKVLKEEEQE